MISSLEVSIYYFPDSVIINLHTEFPTMALDKRNKPIKSSRLCNYRTATRATDVRGCVVARVALVRASHGRIEPCRGLAEGERRGERRFSSRLSAERETETEMASALSSSRKDFAPPETSKGR